MERIEQNLLRLSDIVEELESRLASVRSQAGRARKYKEFSDRLRELRTQVGLADWRKLSVTLENYPARNRSLRGEVGSIRQTVAVHDEELLALEHAVDQLEKQSREANSQATSVREKIAQNESLRRSQLARSDELTEETERLEKQLLAMSTRAGSAQQMVAEATEQLQTSEAQFCDLEGRVQQQQAELDLAQAALAQCRSDLEGCREQHTQAFHEATQLEHRIQTLETQQQTALATGDRLRLEVEKAKEAKSESSGHFAIARRSLATTGRISAQQSQHELLGTQEKSLRQQRGQLAKAQAALAELKGRLAVRKNVLGTGRIGTATGWPQCRNERSIASCQGRA